MTIPIYCDFCLKKLGILAARRDKEIKKPYKEIKKPYKEIKNTYEQGWLKKSLEDAAKRVSEWPQWMKDLNAALEADRKRTEYVPHITDAQ